MTEKYFRTLFIPGLFGQFKVWKNEIIPVCNRVERIVSFGNLIGADEDAADGKDRGRNEATLTYVNTYRTYLDNWEQLIGPNEIAALNSPDTWTNEGSIKHLQSQWLDDDGVFKVASATHGRLHTYGGLTYGEWVSIGRPETADEAADRLNEKYLGTLYQGPAFLLGNRPNYAANPIWAHPQLEFWPSWITTEEVCPFDQIHASGDLNNTNTRSLIKDPTNPLAFIEDIRYKNFGSTCVVNPQHINSVNLDISGVTMNRLENLRALYIEKVLN